jgi:hypothetical protein
MAELKTRPTDASVLEFLDAVPDPKRRRDGFRLLEQMTAISGEPACMWGGSIVGFGSYRYQHRSGTAADWPRTAFSPRKAAMTVYIMPGFAKAGPMLERLGPHTKSVSCLYLKDLDRINLEVLSAIIRDSLDEMRRLYPV